MTAKTHLHVRYFKPIAPLIFKYIKVNSELYVDMRRYLIQGANIYDPVVHEKYNNFQGGYRQELEILSQSQHGSSWIDGYKLGFRYKPNPYFIGHDSITYRLVSALTQASDAQCIHIFVGNTPKPPIFFLG